MITRPHILSLLHIYVLYRTFSGLGSLPNTRNKISKWSIRRFGIDVTEMGPPPRARVAGRKEPRNRSRLDRKLDPLVR